MNANVAGVFRWSRSLIYYAGFSLTLVSFSLQVSLEEMIF